MVARAFSYTRNQIFEIQHIEAKPIPRKFQQNQSKQNAIKNAKIFYLR